VRTEVSGGGMYSGISARGGSFRLETLPTSLAPVATIFSSKVYSAQSLVGTAISMTGFKKGGVTLVGVTLWVPEEEGRGRRLANLTSWCWRETPDDEDEDEDEEDDREYELASGPLGAAMPGRALDKPEAKEKELPRPEDEEGDLDKAGPDRLFTSVPLTSKY